MSGGSDKIQTCVNAKINLIDTTRLLLLQHIGLMLIIKEFDDWHPRITIVDVVSKAGRVDHGKAD